MTLGDDAYRFPASATVTGGTPTLREVVAVLDEVYPRGLAERWDAVGLVGGDLDAEIERVLLAVDVTDVTVSEALEVGADLMVVHHPLFLTPVHGVGTDTVKGRLLHRLTVGGCGLFTAHTNADSAAPGVSDALARVLGLTDLTPLAPVPADPMDVLVVHTPVAAAEMIVDALADAGAGVVGDQRRHARSSSGTSTSQSGPDSAAARSEVAETRIEMILPRARRAEVLRGLRAVHPYAEPEFELVELAAPASSRGLGRVGTLRAPTTLRAFVDQVGRALPRTLSGIRIAGPMDSTVHRIAVCGGAGDGLLAAARASGADVFVTSDLRHHAASESIANGRPWLVDVAHWASEWPWLLGARERLLVGLQTRGQVLDAQVSRTSTDPWTGSM